MNTESNRLYRGYRVFKILVHFICRHDNILMKFDNLFADSLITETKNLPEYQENRRGNRRKISIFNGLIPYAMAQKDLSSPRVIHINHLMAEINSLTDEIYEGLMDYDIENVSECAQRLIDLLIEVKTSTGDVV